MEWNIQLHKSAYLLPFSMASGYMLARSLNCVLLYVYLSRSDTPSHCWFRGLIGSAAGRSSAMLHARTAGRLGVTLTKSAPLGRSGCGANNTASSGNTAPAPTHMDSSSSSSTRTSSTGAGVGIGGAIGCSGGAMVNSKAAWCSRGDRMICNASHCAQIASIRL